MGTFSVTFGVGNLAGTEFIALEGLVDTGSTYTSLPGSVLRSLDVRPKETRVFVLANEERVRHEIGEARIKIGDRDFPVLVMFASDAAAPLLGMTTLENFGFAVDSVNERLVPVEGLLKEVNKVTGR